MTWAQITALRNLCARYGVTFKGEHYTHAFDLPTGWVNGWVGGDQSTIFVGCAPDGSISS